MSDLQGILTGDPERGQDPQVESHELIRPEEKPGLSLGTRSHSGDYPLTGELVGEPELLTR